MPIPRAVARLNRVGVNRITKRIFPWLPGFGVVVHYGRRTGRTYQTPVNVFRTDDGFVLALVYGADTDWVRNVLAAGGCELHTRGRRYQMVAPRIFHDQTRRAIRRLDREVLKVIGVSDFLALERAGPR